ncbi:hypothetical protein FISHEDRAFT_77428 [Fistulina hepatica ATCC 64428]|uniref:Uncharacterized protein n=1 Tax=Fistulina hepatica ATCC 64428 TaxID=1128425 RepID=A0A0D7A3M0_9AGAR|nr:hypothetical protein FISHEDRAFT_77428 [Fistulina hepatica ATCC 64428]
MAAHILPLSWEAYQTIKQQYPAGNRREWTLRTLDAFWKDPQTSAAAAAKSIPLQDHHDWLNDPDPLGHLVKEGPELGILLRTDFTNDVAWAAFCEKVDEAEKEVADMFAAAEPSVSSKDQAMRDADAMLNDGSDDAYSSDDDDEDALVRRRLIRIIDPSTLEPASKDYFAGISNICALRMFNTPAIRLPPSRPNRVNRVPPNRLVDQDGFQEVYSGMTVWIYDARSNEDQCVRLVRQEGDDIYGTATGDSWRAKGTHICELQFNMAMGMKIDFGAQDRYDYAERQRNLSEANNVP